MSRNYLEAFVILVVSFALGFFLVLPKYQELQGLQRQIDEKTGDLQTRKDRYEKLAQLWSELEQYQESWSKIDTALPVGMDAPAVMNFLQTAAGQSGLVYKDIGYNGASAKAAPPQENSTGPVLQKYEISMAVSGKYDDFKNFLAILEKSSRLIFIDTLKIGNQTQDQDQNNSGAENSSENISCEMKFSVNYYQPVRAQKGAENAAISNQ